jgi:hypothetical protein
VVTQAGHRRALVRVTEKYSAVIYRLGEIHASTTR